MWKWHGQELVVALGRTRSHLGFYQNYGADWRPTAKLNLKQMFFDRYLYRPHLRKRHDGGTIKDDECSKGRCVIPGWPKVAV